MSLTKHKGSLMVHARVRIKGKFLYLGDEKFYCKGTTYGTFAPDSEGAQFPPREVVAHDFSLMAAHGFNCVRTYTVPPRYLLDLALHYNLKVMVGLPWEQHLTFLDNKQHAADIVRRVQQGAAVCAGHPALLCFAIGNEIPAPMVRWYGKQKIEAFLKRLYRAVKKVDPDCLCTYVNYPTTEYLNLGFLDFDCFNVYLETPEKLSAYILRLHNLCGDRPLLLAEIGLDSMRHGEPKQAEVLRWQVQTIFGRGCAGMFVFAWTDEWWRGGFEIEDWDFGLVDRERQPKLALPVVAEALHSVPYWVENMPLISVVVCSFNGSATIRDTMEGLQKLMYPHYEVVVVNDGSTDNFADIVKEYPVQLISTPNRGLSSARNTGARAAKGEIIAFIDDDAYPDPHWLQYLAYAYAHTTHAGMGGPNLAPEEDGPIAHCVANAPGGPVHVLTSDEVAEHIPGCNMSFRRKAYLQVGGCDSLYRAAGDDVDLCWRLQQAGYTIGYHPAALVWHHRRNSLKAYWKQQKGYGKAEALLEHKWPEKYNGFGHLAWAGRIYGNGLTLPLRMQKGKVFHGSWGSALFQSVYQPAQGFFSALPLMPEWYLMVALLGFLSVMGWFWTGLGWALPALLIAVGVVVAQALASAVNNSSLPQGLRKKRYLLLIALLHLLQPVARLYGRLKHGLTPWRKRKSTEPLRLRLPLRSRQHTAWTEKWRSAEDWLQDVETHLIELKTRVRRGGDFDRWDLQTRNGFSSISRALFTIEEHGAGKQMVRMKLWARPSKSFFVVFGFFATLAGLSLAQGSVPVAVLLSCLAILFLVEFVWDTAVAVQHFQQSLNVVAKRWNEPEAQTKISEPTVVIHDNTPTVVHLDRQPATQVALAASRN